MRTQGLDHVALIVTDLEASALWYEQVLGLQRISPPLWQPSPIMMLAGQSGIALFQAPYDTSTATARTDGICIEHLAFRIDAEDLESARRELESRGIDVKTQDHHYFRSLYFHDPDGHQLELTALVVDPQEFFGVE